MIPGRASHTVRNTGASRQNGHEPLVFTATAWDHGLRNHRPWDGVTTRR